MFNDEFKERYTTIPFAVYKGYFKSVSKDIIAHQHREIEIISMIEGEAVFYINSQNHHIKKGDILLIPPYTLHRIHVSPNELTAYYCICFDLVLLYDQWLKSGLESQTISAEYLIPKDADYCEQSHEYIKNAFIACENKNDGWELISIGNMSLLFGILKNKNCFTQNTKSKKETNFVKIVMKYIIAHYNLCISSRTIANELFMDHSFFCRTFKKNFGCCFTEYIHAYRLEKAQAYLANTNLSITDVAFKVGFNDCSYFCKVFKAHFGTSPLSYRKAIAR